MKGGQSKPDSTKTGNKLKSKGAGAGKRAKKAAKDPNKPKRPPSAFFVFMEEFRKQYKEENPDNRSVAAVGKASGAKWKSMTDAEKAPYVQKADNRKTEYNKNIQAYNMKLAGGGGNSDESDKSKSEVNDDDEAGSGEDEDED
ncbi:hypothetical protein V6N11_075831 [Hibiscus sabdariffa]|uniref:HMG box domain-containing protein n=1 Tax=Hibiscus sabdariffa TaxID=183260 RepID=A0ABR2Q4F0_9ROSI